MLKDSITLTNNIFITILLLLLSPISHASGARDYNLPSSASTQESNTSYKPHPLGEWGIHGLYGIGRTGGENVTIGIMKEQYADKIISIRKSQRSNNLSEYVISSKEEELFTTTCFCKYNSTTKKWVGNSNRVPLNERKMRRVSTTNPKYRTQSGIGVGSTLSELRKAYSEKVYDLDVDHKPDSSKYATGCMVPKKRPFETIDGVEKMIFKLGPAKGKSTFILSYDPTNQVRPYVYDPNAVIIGIDIGEWCFPPD